MNTFIINYGYEGENQLIFKSNMKEEQFCEIQNELGKIVHSVSNYIEQQYEEYNNEIENEDILFKEALSEIINKNNYDFEYCRIKNSYL